MYEAHGRVQLSMTERSENITIVDLGGKDRVVWVESVMSSAESDLR